MSIDGDLIRRKFERIGARAITREAIWFSIDLKADRKGEYFDIRIPQGVDDVVEVVDARPSLHHLLLLVKNPYRKDKFLCGHDERHWFVAAMNRRDVSNVATALEALKPDEVKQAERAKLIRTRDKMRRRSEAFIRQGEWFFVPWPDVYPGNRPVVRNEPLRRAPGSKPHVCEEIFRVFGLTLYVSTWYPMGLYLWDYRRVLEREPGAQLVDWWPRRDRNPGVFARGRVRHPDHKTIYLKGWHQVFMNTEAQASASRDVRYLD